MLEQMNDYLLWGFDGLTDFVIPFLIVLSVLVFVHEWGHYIVARMCGVKVEKFSIGFGKELFGYTDKAGTRWKFSLIPLGGYVQMFGDSDPASAYNNEIIGDDESDQRPMTADERKVAFFNKPVWQRAAIVFAGPAINFIFAIILMVGLYVTTGKPVTPPVADAIIVESAADKAGLQPHDRIMAIDGKKIASFNDIQRQVAISLDRPLALTVERNGSEFPITITPELKEFEDRFGFSHTRGVIGVIGSGAILSLNDIVSINNLDIQNLSNNEKINAASAIFNENSLITLDGDGENRQLRVKIDRDLNDDMLDQVVLSDSPSQELVVYSLPKATVEAFKETWFLVDGTLEALGQIITGVRSTDELGGLIRIGAIAGDAASIGIVAFISFAAMLSINLGLINLFPIPLLDGGHLVFYAYEALFRRPMPPKVMDYAMKAGLVFLVLLMAYANLNDIVQIIL